MNIKILLYYRYFLYYNINLGYECYDIILLCYSNIIINNVGYKILSYRINIILYFPSFLKTLFHNISLELYTRTHLLTSENVLAITLKITTTISIIRHSVKQIFSFVFANI